MRMESVVENAMQEEIVSGQRWAGLDLLRGVATLQVAYNHVGGLFDALFPWLKMAPWLHRPFSVSIFFLISGMVTMQSAMRTIESPTPQGFARFILRRLMRFYPAYLTCLMITVGMVMVGKLFGIEATHDLPWSSLPREFLMLHGPLNVIWNYPTWTLNVLVWVLISVFPIWFVFLSRIKSHAWLAVLVLVEIIMYAYLRNDSSSKWIAMASRVVFPLAIGMALCRWKSIGFCIPKTPANILAILAVLSYYGGSSFFGAGGVFYLYWMIFTIVVLVFSLTMPGVVFESISRYAFFATLGRLSFSIYLSHSIVQRVIKVLLPPGRFAGGELPLRLGVACIYLLGFVLMAFFINRFVEMPFERMRKAYFAKRKEKLTLPALPQEMGAVESPPAC